MNQAGETMNTTGQAGEAKPPSVLEQLEERRAAFAKKKYRNISAGLILKVTAAVLLSVAVYGAVRKDAYDAGFFTGTALVFWGVGETFNGEAMLEGQSAVAMGALIIQQELGIGNMPSEPEPPQI